MKRSEFKRRLSAVMKGSDLKYEVQDKEEISCNLCMSIAFQPVNCNVCHNIFCEECFKTFISEVKACPLGCAEPACAKASENVIQRVKACVFLCPNKTNGCTKDISYDEVAQHELTCPYKLIKCSGYKLCKMMCLRQDLYSHESLCPYSAINHKAIQDGMSQSDDREGSRCMGCAICNKESACFDYLKNKVHSNHNELCEVLNNLTGLIKRQDEEIKELKLRLEKVEDQRSVS